MSMPTVSRPLRSRRTAAIVGALVLLLSSAGLAEARGAPGWLTRLFYAATGRSLPMAVGDTTIVYGPKLFALGANSTSGTFVERITVAPGTAVGAMGQGYVLRVTNGYNGAPAIASGTVKLNGVTVASGSFGSLRAGQTVDVPVQLNSGDLMEATLQGPKGAAIRATLLAVPDPTFVVFGPKLYTRASGGAVTVTDHFALPAGTAAPRYLCFRNGDADGTHKSSSVTVRLNGVEILGTTGLNNYVTAFRKPVTLLANNTLEVKLLGATGSHFTVCATATDATAPKIAITAPLPKLITRQSTLTAVGTVTDQTPVTVLVNGLVATLTAGTAGQTSFTATVPLATEGNNNILIRATDAAGNRTDSTRVVIRDTQAPVVSLVSLPDTGSTSRDSSLVVNGTIRDLTKVTANLNGSPITIDSASGAFSKRITLATGVNFLTLVATDAAGNVTTVVRQLTRTAMSPTLTVTAPADSQVTRAATIHVVGTATASAAVTVTVNGVAAPMAAGGAFAADVALTEGINRITVIATTAGAPPATTTRIVIRDTQAPVAAFTAPVEGFVTKAGTVTVSGTATDATRLTITLNGVAVAAAQNTGAFSVVRPLVEGPATFTLVVTDAAGNVTTVTRHVTRDATAPVLTLIDPAPGAFSRTAAYRVTGSVSDATTVTVTVNGIAAPVAADGSFAATVTLANGANAVAVIATDAAGNQSTVSGSVTLDASAPAVTVTSPADGFATKSATLVVSGTAFDQSGVTVLVNGVPAVIDGTGAFRAEVELAEGANTVTVLVTDAAGNTTSAVRQAVLDTQAPVVSLSSPSEGQTTTAATISVSGTVSDASTVTVVVNGVDAELAGESFNATVPLSEGANSVTIVATDAVGNTVTIERSVTRNNGTPPGPTPQFVERLGIDASLNAPALDRTVMRPLTASSSFIYAGAGAPQQGVATSTIDPAQAGILRGRVLDRDGTPLGAVTIRVLSHPEYGVVHSRSNGIYELVVNAGGYITLDFQHPSLIPAQRSILSRQQDFTVVPDVALVALDSAATVVTFTAPIEVARGNQVSDRNGARRTTMLFSQGTVATATRTDGTERVLSSLTIRATEFTIGPNGKTAMPAALPPTSEYTYAVELSADEVSLTGSEALTFSQPIGLYVENFRGFPVGISVPMGYYDRQRGAWIAEENGRVVRVLAVNDGSAVLDVHGDSSAATQEALDSLGITSAELSTIGELYGAGQSLMRAPITHFSPHDGNFAKADAPRPTPIPPDAEKPKPCTKKQGGSIIDCENQVLGETVGIAGTNLSLSYRSNRIPGRGRAYSLEIPLTDSIIPPNLIDIEVDVKVGGRSFEVHYDPATNLKATFVWDGIDAFGRSVSGAQPYSVDIQYRYPTLYTYAANDPQAFGLRCNPLGPTTTDVSYVQCIIPGVSDLEKNLRIGMREYSGTFGWWTAAEEQGFGGWTLSPQHVYDPTSKTLHLGNGEQISGREAVKPDRQVLTGANGEDAICSCHVRSTNRVATEVYHGTPTGITVTPTGDVIFADSANNMVDIIRRNGTFARLIGGTTVDESGNHPPYGSTELGHPGQSSQIFRPRGVALGQDGSVYVSESAKHRVVRLRPDSILELMAGAGTPDSTGDGGPARLATLKNPSRLSAANDGSLYILDEGNRRVRVVSPGGRISTVAGGGTSEECKAEGIIATAACLTAPSDIAVSADGTLYIVEQGRVRAVSAGGVISTIAGSGGRSCRFSVYEGPAAGLRFCPNAIALGLDSRVYILDRSFVRRVDADGWMVTVRSCGEGGPQDTVRPQTELMVASAYRGGPRVPDDMDELFLGALAVDPEVCLGAVVGANNTLYMAESPARIARIDLPTPGYPATDFIIAATDGSEFYEFDVNVRHIKTSSVADGRPTMQLSYDTTGRLAGIVDRFGQTITVTRDGTGKATTIRAPFGQVTRLTYDAGGWLSTTRYPDESSKGMTYAERGLLASFTDAMGGTTSFQYDSLGRFQSEDGPLGYHQSLRLAFDSATGLPSAYFTNAAGLTTINGTDAGRGGEQTRVATLPGGAQSTSSTRVDGTSSTENPDGTSTRSVVGADPVFGMQVPRTKSITMSGTGLGNIWTRWEHQVELGTPGDARTVRHITDSVWVNDRLTRTTYDILGQVATTEHPDGTADTAYVDANGNVTRAHSSGLAAVHYQYDSVGRRISVAVAGRKATLAYDIHGMLIETVDPIGNRTRFRHDAMGRVLSVIRPDSQEVRITYDAAGRMRTFTPAGRSAYRMTYDLRGRLDSTIAPAAGGDAQAVTRYTYDAARLLSVTKPDGRRTTHSYDDLGNAVRLSAPGLEQEFVHDPWSGTLNSITASTGDTLVFGYRGSLTSSIAWSGRTSGAVYLGYTEDLSLSSVEVAGGRQISSSYRPDAKLATAGDLTIAYDSATGMVGGLRLGDIITTIERDSLGEIRRRAHSSPTMTLLEQRLTYDSLGRVISLAELNGADSVRTTYDYDAAGRLKTVRRSNAEVARYEYDQNGNRLRLIAPSGTIVSTYDERDRVISSGTARFGFSLNGERTARIDGDSVTRYAFDALGQLTDVVLPSGETISYEYDPAGHRTGRRRDGRLTQRLIYQSMLAPAAELDSAGNVVAQFVYANHINVPDYMVRADGTTYRFILDERGSVRQVVDVATGEVLQRMSYDEWGRTTENTNPSFQPFGYAGGLVDDEAKLIHFGAREYDPETAQWLSADPRGLAGGSANQYSYALNDPIQIADPLGLWPAWTHDALIQSALGGVATSSEIEAIQNASKAFDSPFEASNDPRFGSTQTPARSFMHSMSDGSTEPPQEPIDAANLRDAFITKMLNRARDLARACNKAAALHYLGIAIHPLMDMTSPLHVGENGLPLPWTGKLKDEVTHVRKEVMAATHVDPEVFRINDQLIRGAFNFVFEY